MLVNKNGAWYHFFSRQEAASMIRTRNRLREAKAQKL